MLSPTRHFTHLLAIAVLVAGCAVKTGTATLTWTVPTQNTDGTPIGEVAGYYIYFGTSPTSMTQTIQVPDGRATSYLVSNLKPGTYYFSIAAYEASNAQSARVGPVSYTIR